MFKLDGTWFGRLAAFIVGVPLCLASLYLLFEFALVPLLSLAWHSGLYTDTCSRGSTMEFCRRRYDLGSLILALAGSVGVVFVAAFPISICWSLWQTLRGRTDYSAQTAVANHNAHKTKIVNHPVGPLVSFPTNPNSDALEGELRDYLESKGYRLKVGYSRDPSNPGVGYMVLEEHEGARAGNKPYPYSLTLIQAYDWVRSNVSKG